jgi:chromate transporter
MARTLCPDRPRATIAVITAGTAVLWQQAAMQMALIALAGVAGLILLKDMVLPPVGAAVRTSVSRGVAIAALAVFVCLLLALPATWALTKNGSFAVIDSFYRVGSLVFGGGHVVLPLIESEVVEPGWVSPDQFAAGYGAAQAVPGPLFTFSAFLGAVMTPGLGGWLGGGVALVAVFAPTFLLVWGTLPFWDRLRGHLGARRALAGINAAVVGLLGAALYDPIWRTAVHTGADFAVALGAFGLLAFWRWPPWLVVALTAVAGLALPRLP